LTKNKPYVACRQGSGGDALARKLRNPWWTASGPSPPEPGAAAAARAFPEHL